MGLTRHVPTDLLTNRPVLSKTTSAELFSDKYNNKFHSLAMQVMRSFKMSQQKVNTANEISIVKIDSDEGSHCESASLVDVVNTATVMKITAFGEGGRRYEHRVGNDQKQKWLLSTRQPL